MREEDKTREYLCAEVRELREKLLGAEQRIAELQSAEQKLQCRGKALELLARERSHELSGLKSRLEEEMETRTKAERIVDTRSRLLDIMGASESKKEFLDNVVQQLHEWSDCSCVGIRVLNGSGAIPYASSRGFGEEFRRSENMLLLDRDDCICTRIVMRKPKPPDASCMTSGGSFRCHDTGSFSSCVPEEERSSYRGVCAKSGFASVAAIPIRHKDRPIGLIHLADYRPAMLPDSQMETFEAIAPLIGEAICRFTAGDELRKTCQIQQVIDSILRFALEEQDLQQILDQALEKILSIPDLPAQSSGSIYLAEGHPENLVLRASKGPGAELMRACGPIHMESRPFSRPLLTREARIACSIPAGAVPLASYCVPISSSGKILGILNITVNHGHVYDRQEEGFLLAVANALAGVIERKAIEEKLKLYVQKLEQSNQDLEQFAYIASHDLNEPLRKVQAFANFLTTKLGASVSEDIPDRLQRIQTAATRMQRLLNDLLEYSRIRTKRRPIEKVDLKMVAEEAVSDLWVRIKRSGGVVRIGDLPSVEADPTQVRQLLQNLIANALKFCCGKSPEIKIQGRSERGNCTICVEDNGIGFDEKYLNCIFNPCQRLHGRAEFKGSGMGLAICRRIVERHHGSITAKSKPGEGSTFIVTLPRQQPQAEIETTELRSACRPLLQDGGEKRESLPN